MDESNHLKVGVREEYNSESAWMNRSNPRRVWLKEEKRILAKLVPNSGTKLLDLGCGRGELIDIMIGGMREIYEVDFAKVLIDQARIRHSGISKTHHILCDVSNLPFQNNIFDLVLAIEVIAHIPNLTQLFSEIRRVMKNGGILIISTGNRISINWLLNSIIRCFRIILNNKPNKSLPIIKQIFANDRYFEIKNRKYSDDSFHRLKTILLDNSFKIEEIRGVGLLGLECAHLQKIDRFLLKMKPLNLCSSLLILKCTAV